MGDDGSPVLDEIFINSTWYDFFATYIYPTVQDSIQFNCPVSLIDYSHSELNSVYLACESGDEVLAKKVIVTASVNVLNSGIITFQPSLPDDYADILENYELIKVLKGFITFREAFYEEGTSFEIYSIPYYEEETGSIIFWDAAYGQPSSTNVLGVIITERYLDDFQGLSDQQILYALLTRLDEVYGGRANETYIEHILKDWTKEDYILGGWTTSRVTSDALMTLLEPLGNATVYLAGEGIPHDGWSSTIPAAALSGQTAACRVLRADFDIDSGCTFLSTTTDAPASPISDIPISPAADMPTPPTSIAPTPPTTITPIPPTSAVPASSTTSTPIPPTSAVPTPTTTSTPIPPTADSSTSVAATRTGITILLLMWGVSNIM